MVQMTTILMGSVLFALGLILGLVFQLPGTSSPGHDRHPRDLRAVMEHHGDDTQQVGSLFALEVGENRDVQEGLVEITLEDIVFDNQKQASVKTAPLIDPSDGSRPLSPTHSVNSNKEFHSPTDNELVKRSQVDISSVTDSRRFEGDSHKGHSATHTVMVSVGNERTVTRGKSRPNLDTVYGYNNNNNSNTTHDRVQENKANYGRPSDIQNHTSSKSNSKSFVSGVYWSTVAEALTPTGFSDQQRTQWRHKLENNKIISVSDGCGRMQNRQLLLSDATLACARYRLNTDQIQGEIYSYYLSRVLGVSHVPPSVLVTTDPRAERWRRVNQALTTAQWSPDKVAIITPWVDALQPAYIPKEFQTKARQLQPRDLGLTDQRTDDIAELVQWSDLVVFDYLTANLDRVVNNLYNEQWNPDMMRSPAHNLEKVPTSGLLVFLDNESGLFHSYRLLEKYSGYHSALLKSLCVFRRGTAQKIKELHESGQVGTLIMDMFRTEDPLYRYVPKLPDRTVGILQQRLADVYKQITYCEGVYNS